MTCAEVHEYVFAFLDNELDAPLSIELQRHLDRCHGCARETEIERAIRKQLEKLFDASAVGVPPMDESLGGILSHKTGTRNIDATVKDRASWKPLLTRAAVLLVIIAGAMWFALSRDAATQDGARFADLVVTDLEHFLEKGKPLQIASADPGAVASWLYEQTDLQVTLPSKLDPLYELVGGRKCKLFGRPAAFAMYHVHGVPASLLVVAGGDAELDGMEPIRNGERTHWVDHCRGHTVVACKRGNKVYAAVSRLSEQELLPLMTDMVNEGD